MTDIELKEYFCLMCVVDSLAENARQRFLELHSKYYALILEVSYKENYNFS